MYIKELFLKTLSLGGSGSLPSGRKFALQVAVMDGYCSVAAFGFYAIFTYLNGQVLLSTYHSLCLSMMVLGLWLIHKHWYDSGRWVIHLFGLFGIYFSNDAFGMESGFEYYYFVSIMMPHITFSLDEVWKGIPLSAIACVTLILQWVIGTGRLHPPLVSPPEEKIVAIIIVVLFTVSILAVTRWRLYQAKQEVQKQQSELIHSANMIALGEMATEIAHEINNPLQSLSLQLKVLQEKYSVMNCEEDFSKMNGLIDKVAKMIQGLKHLSVKESEEVREEFVFSRVLEDVLIISSNRLKNFGIQVYISGDSELKSVGNSVQISQILINLLNNSIDAVSSLPEKWIKINITSKCSLIEISVTDSGKGIPPVVEKKMMEPFFTTKPSHQGTGLGLSISRNIAEKNGGCLYYDATSAYTRFVLLLPLSEMSLKVSSLGNQSV